MRTIIFTNDWEMSDYLVSSNTLLNIYVFSHFLINHRVINHIKYDIELCEQLDVEVVIVVYYENNELLEYAKQHLKDSGYELEVV